MAIAIVDDPSDAGANRILRRRVWPANTVDIFIRVVSVITGQLYCAFSSRVPDKI